MSIPHRPTERVQLRASVHSGSVVAGIQVVGSKMPRYRHSTTATWQQLQVILPWIHRLFGDTVDVAAMINTTGEGGNEWSRFNAFTKLFLALKIHISLETKLLLDIHGCFKCEHRGAIDIKVKVFRCNVLCLNTMLCLGKGDGWLLLATFQRGRNIKAIKDG